MMKKRPNELQRLGFDSLSAQLINFVTYQVILRV